MLYFIGINSYFWKHFHTNFVVWLVFPVRFWYGVQSPLSKLYSCRCAKFALWKLHMLDLLEYYPSNLENEIISKLNWSLLSNIFVMKFLLLISISRSRKVAFVSLSFSRLRISSFGYIFPSSFWFHCCYSMYTGHQ